jgi:hypothetical protein
LAVTDIKLIDIRNSIHDTIFFIAFK